MLVYNTEEEEMFYFRVNLNKKDDMMTKDTKSISSNKKRYTEDIKISKSNKKIKKIL